ncbi:MAG: AMP phosphorylase [Nanoarchaeota archaeon]
MKLKVKRYKLSAGRPIAIINKETAKILSANLNDRILIKYNSKRIVAVLDLSSQISNKKEIVLSTEIMDFLEISGGEMVVVDVAKKPRAIQTINKKLKCDKLSKEEIFLIIKSIVNNEITETEIAFFISAVYECGMSMDEIVWMTEAIFKTGKKLKLNKKIIVDKHSIGGLAGNRTTPLVVSICAAAGLTFPKTSSRAITSAAGTADVMEAICKVDFSPAELKKIINKTNACLAWGGSLGFAPADDKIIRVESQINIDPEPNLIASIMAKKLSVGSKFILIDIPYGKYAKVDKTKALDLKKKFEEIGKRFNLKLKCVITDGSQPIGHGVGPILELIDIIKILKCEKDAPIDLKNKSLFLAGEIFELVGKVRKGKGSKLALEILDSGKAFNKFKEIVEAQKGKLIELKPGKFSYEIKTNKKSRVISIDNKKINILAKIAGSPNDKKAGVYLYKHLGESLDKGKSILTIYSSSKNKLKDAVDFYRENNIIALR